MTDFPNVKLKVIPTFPANVTAQSPIVLTKDGGHYDFSLDIAALLALISGPTADVIQIVTSGLATILPDTTLLVVQRAAPTLTQLTMPPLGGPVLSIVDWSTSVADHEIRLTPLPGQTIMRAATWSVFSNSAQLGSLALHPNSILSGWYIAP